MAESVCTVERLSEIITSSFSTIPVVNMYGCMIGLIPKHFIIALIENHCFYEHENTDNRID